jgi:hypothetical protein
MVDRLSVTYPSVNSIEQHRTGQKPTEPGGRLPPVTTMLTLVANSRGMKLEGREVGAAHLGKRRSVCPGCDSQEVDCDGCDDML